MRFQTILTTSLFTLAFSQVRQDTPLSLTKVLSTTLSTIQFHSDQISNIVARMNVGDSYVKRTALESNLNEIQKAIVDADKLVPELKKIVVNGRKITAHLGTRDAVLDFGPIQQEIDIVSTRLSRAADINASLRTLSNDFTETSNDALDSLFSSVYATQKQTRRSLKGIVDPVISTLAPSLEDSLAQIVNLTAALKEAESALFNLNATYNLPVDGTVATIVVPEEKPLGELNLVKRNAVTDLVDNLKTELASVPLLGSTLSSLTAPLFQELDSIAGKGSPETGSNPGKLFFFKAGRDFTESKIE